MSPLDPRVNKQPISALSTKRPGLRPKEIARFCRAISLGKKNISYIDLTKLASSCRRAGSVTILRLNLVFTGRYEESLNLGIAHNVPPAPQPLVAAVMDFGNGAY